MPSSIYKQVASQPYDFSLVAHEKLLQQELFSLPANQVASGCERQCVSVAGCFCAMQKKVKRRPAVANDASVSAPKLLKAVFTVNRIRTPLQPFDLFINLFFGGDKMLFLAACLTQRGCVCLLSLLTPIGVRF